MSEIFRQKEFVPDTTYLRILQEVSDVPGCKISHVVSRMIPEYGEYDVRQRVHQLVLRRYLFEGRANTETHLSITGKGRGCLQAGQEQSGLLNNTGTSG
jgi:hypothetical protein